MLGQVDPVYGHGPPSVASVPRTYTHPGIVPNTRQCTLRSTGYLFPRSICDIPGTLLSFVFPG